MRRFNDVRYKSFGGMGDVDDIHLRARDHDVAYLHFTDLQHALYHGERICIHQTVFISAV